MIPINLSNVATVAAGLAYFWGREDPPCNIWQAGISYPESEGDSNQLWDIAAAVAIIFIEESIKRGTLRYGYYSCVKNVAQAIAKRDYNRIWNCPEISPNEKVRMIINETLDAHATFED